MKGRTFGLLPILIAVLATPAGCGGGGRAGNDVASISGGGGCSGTGPGTATLSWIPPSRNQDGGSPITLIEFHVYCADSTGAHQLIATVVAPDTTTVVTGIEPGITYFAVTAVDDLGTESGFSNIESKAIPY